MLYIKIHSTQMSPEHVKKEICTNMFDVQTQLYPKTWNCYWVMSDMFVIVHKKYEWINVCRKDLHLKQEGPVKQAGGNNL